MPAIRLLSSDAFRRILNTLLAVGFVFIQLCPLHAASSKRPELVAQVGHAGSIYTMKFSPDGTWLATGSSDNTIKLWNLETSSSFRSLNVPGTGGVGSIAIS